ncbi:exportin-7-like [Parus major]|uniref:exportin-7-like n=1 Tax=Parus major TaxID=9157 RepID=UPI001443A601|nr:exportin-7-like [Parus major]
MQLLKLTHNCLNFDFIGTSTDESSDDLCTVQIPTSWRSAFLDSSTLQLFFDLYHSIPPSFSPLVLSCLVQIASVRRSLFNNAERAKFLSHLVDGVKRILENPQVNIPAGNGGSVSSLSRFIPKNSRWDGLEDPLEDTGLVQQQLDQLSTIGRCEYEKTCALLVQLFDQAAQSYQELLQSASASPMDLAVQEVPAPWT